MGISNSNLKETCEVSLVNECTLADEKLFIRMLNLENLTDSIVIEIIHNSNYQVTSKEKEMNVRKIFHLCNLELKNCVSRSFVADEISLNKVKNAMIVLINLFPDAFSCKADAFLFEHTFLSGSQTIVILFENLLAILFKSKFCLPEEALENEEEINFWESGVGIDSAMICSSELKMRRLLCLRLIIVIYSIDWYYEDEKHVVRYKCVYEWLESRNNKYSVQLLLSLLNVFCKISESPSMFSFNRSSLQAPQYKLLCSQLLILLLHNHDQIDKNPLSIKSLDHDTEINVYCALVSHLENPKNYQIITSGLHNYLYSKNQENEEGLSEESLCLMFRMITLNNKFFQYILVSDKLLDIILAICSFSADCNQSNVKTSALYTSCFILMVLSSSRTFAVRLNTIYKPSEQLPNEYGFHGSYCDVLVNFICDSFPLVIPNGTSESWDVAVCLASILSNISPYIQSLNIHSAFSLITLFETVCVSQNFQSTSTLLSVLELMIESFHNIIQYHYNGNEKFILALILARKSFLNFSDIIESPQEAQSNSGVNGSPDPKAEPDPGEGSKFNCKLFAIRKDMGELSRFHLKTVIKVINILTPLMESLINRWNPYYEENTLSFLKKSSVVGLIPIPTPIRTKILHIDDKLLRWSRQYIWSLIYSKWPKPDPWRLTHPIRIKLDQSPS